MLAHVTKASLGGAAQAQPCSGSPWGLSPWASPPLATGLEEIIQPLCPQRLPAHGSGAVCFLNGDNQTS